MITPTVAIPDNRSTPGNKGAYALRRIEGDTAHFLMVTFWESEDVVRAFAGLWIEGNKVLGRIVLVFQGGLSHTEVGNT
jgi:hypothetical protein